MMIVHNKLVQLIQSYGKSILYIKNHQDYIDMCKMWSGVILFHFYVV